MFRTLFVLAALLLSGCASYGSAQYGERTPVYRDGSYYSPSASGYGDYYYAPEYRYDSYDYYDDFGYGYGYPFGFHDRFCSFRYRPCTYGSRWGSGWGLSLFFGHGWNNWYGWPYYGGWNRHRDWWHDRNWRGGSGRDWDGDHGRGRDHGGGRGDDGDRNGNDRPAPPGTGGNPGTPPGDDRPPSSTPWPMPEPGVRPPGSRPWPIRDPRNPGYRDEGPTPREEQNGGGSGGWQRYPNAAKPRPGIVVGPMPQPRRGRDVGGGQAEPQPPPQPRAPQPRERSEDNDGNAPPPPPRRERERVNLGEDREVRRDGARRPALQ